MVKTPKEYRAAVKANPKLWSKRGFVTKEGQNFAKERIQIITDALRELDEHDFYTCGAVMLVRELAENYGVKGVKGLEKLYRLTTNDNE